MYSELPFPDPATPKLLGAPIKSKRAVRIAFKHEDRGLFFCRLILKYCSFVGSYTIMEGPA